MTDREKLIKLLSVLLIPNGMCANPAEVVADYLLDNGVTFATDTNVGSKWISVEERLPPYNRDVLVFRPSMAMKVLVDSYGGYWGEDDEEWYEGWDYSKHIPVSHWMPLPKPPKEGC